MLAEQGCINAKARQLSSLPAWPRLAAADHCELVDDRGVRSRRRANPVLLGAAVYAAKWDNAVVLVVAVGGVWVCHRLLGKSHPISVRITGNGDRVPDAVLHSGRSQNASERHEWV